jgi:hypothetical protein
METAMSPLSQAASDALLVQNACNLSGILHTWIEAQKALNTLGMGTEEIANHCVSRLFAAKVIELTGMGFADSSQYWKAYGDCERLLGRE